MHPEPPSDARRNGLATPLADFGCFGTFRQYLKKNKTSHATFSFVYKDLLYEF